MLVLTRKENEKLIIGDGIEVVIVEIRGDKVRLGIEAPPEVRILRSELKERIDREGDLRQVRGGAA